MQIEALSPVLVLHLERSLYVVAVDGIYSKIRKPVQFASVLEIPLSTSLLQYWPRLRIPRSSVGLESWRTLLGNLRSPCTTAVWVLYHHGKFAGSEHCIIRSTCSTRRETAVVGKPGCICTIKLDKAESLVQHENVFGG